MIREHASPMYAPMQASAKLVSDAYVVQFLLQATEAWTPPLAWQEMESGAYASSIGGVRVELACEQATCGSRVYLALCHGAEKVYIVEPRRPASSGEGGRQLVELIRRLHTAAARQCCERQNRPPEVSAQIRNAIYRQILFAEQVE